MRLNFMSEFITRPVINPTKKLTSWAFRPETVLVQKP